MEDDKLLELFGNLQKSLEAIAAGVKVPGTTTTPPATTTPAGSFNLEDIVKGVTEAMNQQTATANNQVYADMFGQKVDELTAKFGAFGDYLNSTDDYGDVILDKIKKSGDFKTQVETLGKVFKTFSKASQAGNDPSMQISKEVQKRAEESQAKSDEIEKKFYKGELSMNEFRDQWFGNIENDLAALQQ